MASRSEWTPDYINTQVFITIDLSAQYDGQTGPTNRNFETAENFEATYGSKLIDVSIKWENLSHLELTISSNSASGQSTKEMDSNSTNNTQIREIGSPTTHP